MYRSMQVHSVFLNALGGCKMISKLRLHLGVLDFYTLTFLGLSNAQLEISMITLSVQIIFLG